MIDPSTLSSIGAYQRDGEYFRDRIRTDNVEYDPSDPKAVAKGLVIGYDEVLVPHKVVLPYASDPASVEEARRKAVVSGADFYHPRHGWLRNGVKREQEAPENLGAGSVTRERRRVTLAPVGAPGDEAPPSPRPQPRPQPKRQEG